jgi:hypothetical protein
VVPRASRDEGNRVNGPITPELDRHNGRLYMFSVLLMYATAPVAYVGVIQAALCDQLGASSTVANLPATAYMMGAFAPFFVSWIVPPRLEKFAVVIGWSLNATTQGLVALVLLFFEGNTFRIGSVIFQSLLYGITASTSQVLMFQCLNRGTTLAGRARALRITYALGPIAAAASSLATQWLLTHNIPHLAFPRDFGLLYLCAAPLTAGAAVLCHRFRLAEVESGTKPRLLRYIRESVGSFSRHREMILAWIAYILWYSVVFATPNISLYTRTALGRDPKDFAGAIMALRFGMKALAGFMLGALALWKGMRAPLVACILLVGGAVVWAWLVPGFPYLLSFGIMGAGELGGIYFPNYLVSVSPLAAGTRNLALLEMAGPVAGASPALHGLLTDRFGFQSSFIFGLAAASLSLALVFWLPSVAVRRQPPQPRT